MCIHIYIHTVVRPAHCQHNNTLPTTPYQTLVSFARTLLPPKIRTSQLATENDYKADFLEFFLDTSPLLCTPAFARIQMHIGNSVHNGGIK